MFGLLRDIRHDYKRVIAGIEEGSRIEPKHNQPPSVDCEGTALLSDDDRAFFKEFERFGSVINAQLQESPWSFHELPTPLVKDYEGPRYGRNYRVHYNALNIGHLALTRFFRDEGACRIEIQYAQFIPYRELFSLLNLLHILFDKLNDGTAERANRFARDTLSEHLWEAARMPDIAMDLEAHISGPYQYYREHAKRLRESL